MGKIFKCYSEGDTPQWMLFLDRKDINKISPKTMRDTFYENFKDLIEQCKELL